MFDYIFIVICFLLIPFVSLLLLFFFETRTWLYRKFFYVLAYTMQKSLNNIGGQHINIFDRLTYFRSTWIGAVLFSPVSLRVIQFSISLIRPLKLMFTFWRIILLLDLLFVAVGITTASISVTLCLASILTSTLWIFRNVYYPPNATPWDQFDAEARAYSIQKNRFHVFDKELYDKKFKEIFHDYWEKKSTAEFMRKAYLRSGPQADAYWYRYDRPWTDKTVIDPVDGRFIRYSIFHAPWENDPEDLPAYILISLMASLSVIVDTKDPPDPEV